MHRYSKREFFLSCEECCGGDYQARAGVDLFSLYWDGATGDRARLIASRPNPVRLLRAHGDYYESGNGLHDFSRGLHWGPTLLLGKALGSAQGGDAVYAAVTGQCQTATP